MTESPEDGKMYITMGEYLIGLKNLEKALYSEQRMSGDQMRDWANWLNQGFFLQGVLGELE